MLARLRHQLPVRSPIHLAALLRGTGSSLPGRGEAPAPTVELAAMLQREWAASSIVLCASGTHALALAMSAALRARGGRGLVALPAYSCFDLVTAAVAADATLAFYDVDPDTLSPDLASLEATLSAGASVVVVAPLYGMPVDWHSVTRAAAAAGAVVIEDAAQCHGALSDGRRVGTFGALTVLSFGRGKGWTGGRGGALLVRDAAVGGHIAEFTAGARRGGRSGSWGRAAAAWALGRPWTYALPASLPWLELGRTVYHEPSPLTLMDDAAATVVMATRQAADAEVATRRLNAGAYRSELGTERRWSPIAVLPGADPSWLRFPLRLDGGNSPAKSDEFMRLGIATGYPQVLPELPAAARRIGASQPCPGASELVRSLIALPTHGWVSRADRASIRALMMSLPGGPGSAAATRRDLIDGIDDAAGAAPVPAGNTVGRPIRGGV
jgi:perosamine synthetase